MIGSPLLREVRKWEGRGGGSGWGLGRGEIFGSSMMEEVWAQPDMSPNINGIISAFKITIL